jgi:DNA-binding response OmpR family regulator/anti-sigma regulatory factor (Ser/Thr protein kinase)
MAEAYPPTDNTGANPEGKSASWIRHKLNNLHSGALALSELILENRDLPEKLRSQLAQLREIMLHSISLLENGQARPQASPTEPEQEQDLSLPSSDILVIDDDDNVRLIFADYLTHAGASVRTAETFARGIDLLNEQKPDLIVTDLNMPDMEIPEFFQRLKEICGDSAPPIILASGRDSKDKLPAGVEEIIQAEIFKPFRMKSALLLVKDILRRGDGENESIRKALVVEDNEVMRQVMCEVLAQRGYRVQAHSNGITGREAIERESFPLLLLDWKLGEISGLDLCRAARASAPNRDSHILMITGKNQPEDLAQALAAGADDYLCKPFGMDIFNIRLTVAEENIVNSRQRRKAEADLQAAHDKLEIRVRERTAELTSLNLKLRDEIAVRTEAETRRKEAEDQSRLQQEQLLQADKLAALGTLVTGVGHEINNPNNFIMLNVPLIKDAWTSVLPILDKYADGKADLCVGGLPYGEMRLMVTEMLDDIMEGARRIKRIVGELKDYAKPQPEKADETADVNRLVESAVSLLDNFIRRHTRKFCVYPGQDLPLARGSSQRIEQVVINLMQNACEALADSSQAVTVSTRFDREKNMLEILVEDRGCGMDAETLRRVADPFFTTKRGSGGTGLGLSISSRILQNLGGSLQFHSEPDRGTTAIVSIPAACETKRRGA